MNTQRFFVFWSGLALSLFCAIALVYPILTVMVPSSLKQLSTMYDVNTFSYQLIWVFSILVYIVTLCLGCGISIYSLYQLGKQSHRKNLILPMVASSVALIVFLLNGFEGANHNIVAFLKPAIGLNKTYDLEYLLASAGTCATAGVCAIFLAVITMIAFTFKGSFEQKGIQEELRSVKLRLRNLKTLLYLAGVSLTSGVIASAMRLKLQIDYTMPKAQIDIAEAFSASATLVYGGFFTLLLLFGYIPTAVILNRWSKELARTINPSASSQELSEWRASQGFETARISTIAQTLAIFAPLLTSIMGDSLSQVVKLFS